MSEENQTGWFDILSKRINETELRLLTERILGKTEYANLRGDTLKDKLMSFLERAEQREKLDTLPQDLQEIGRQDIVDSLKPVSETEPKKSSSISFTNREDEIGQILSSSAPPYFLLDAPAGYGKSSLLEELEKRFV